MAKDQDTFELAVAIQALTARHEVLTIAVQESLRALSKTQADQCAAAIRARVQGLAAAAPLMAIPQADAAIAHELSAVLGVLDGVGR
jgi:vesicle coat complex subunit